MKITSTKRPSKRLEATLKAATSAEIETHAEQPTDAPPIGWALHGQPAQGTDNAVVSPLWIPGTKPKEQNFAEFMGLREVKFARQVWSLIQPAVRADIRDGIKAVWLVLDSAALVSEWSRVTPETDKEDIAKLAIKSGITALSGLSFANAAAGRPTDEIDGLTAMVLHANSLAKGADPMWLNLHNTWKSQSDIYKSTDSFLKLIEIGVGSDTNDVKLNPVRWAANGDPIWPKDI